LDFGLDGHPGALAVLFQISRSFPRRSRIAFRDPVGLGGVEIIAAILFLVPVTPLTGGCAVLVIFGLAALVHLLPGEFSVERLVICAVTMLVCITHGNPRTEEALHDRT
jgi:hypothetical protein